MDSGYVDWASLNAPLAPWQDTGEGESFVYAFVLADDDSHWIEDAGVGVLKPSGSHPDWFVHADKADMVLTGQCPPTVSVSANYQQVLGDNFKTRPLLASLCLGTSDAVYATADRSKYWSCDQGDLTRRGRRLFKDMATLYLREPILLTFLDLRPMESAAPGAQRGQATVSSAPGH